jgi:hypothetical protein
MNETKPTEEEEAEAENEYREEMKRRRDSMVWVVFVAAGLASGKGQQHAANSADALLTRFRKNFKDVT